MTFEVDIAGRTRAVSIERGGRAGSFRVAVDGCTYDVDAARSGEYGVLLTAESLPPKSEAISADKSQQDEGLRPEGGQRDRQKVPASYEVFVTPSGGPGELLVTLDGRTAVVTVHGRRSGRAADTARHADGEQPIVAPMPGRVVRVLVAPGDDVTAKQGVVVVEAMKMENELRAPKSGRVKDVNVSAGTSVEAGRVLLVIE